MRLLLNLLKRRKSRTDHSLLKINYFDVWKNIPNWENYYEINEFGEIRNKVSNKIRVPEKNSCGYLRICLYNKNHNPVKERFFIHRLVVSVFIPNPYDLTEVNHKDSNIENNFVDNLEWISKLNNELHSREFGNKEYKPFKVIYESGKEEIFKTKGELSRKLGLTRSTIKFWLQNKNKGFKNFGISKIKYC